MTESQHSDPEKYSLHIIIILLVIYMLASWYDHYRKVRSKSDHVCGVFSGFTYKDIQAVKQTYGEFFALETKDKRVLYFVRGNLFFDSFYSPYAKENSKLMKKIKKNDPLCVEYSIEYTDRAKEPNPYSIRFYQP